MADTNRKQLELLFRNMAGTEVTLVVLDPKTDVTAAEAAATGAVIVAQNIFTTKGGNLTAYESARIRVLNVTALA